MQLLIIHPGIQHSYHLANGAARSGLFKKVFLLTSILYKTNQKVPSFFKKRIKTIDHEVVVVNHYVYTLLFTISRYLYNKVFVNPLNQIHNNPIYFWQQVFGLCCLPRLYFNRKNILIVCFETAGWPIVKYCKKWGIPVVMDFASISHEKAKTLGINETSYGINIKIKERASIDYGFYCSEFCRKSFEGLTSAKNDFVLYLGAERSKKQVASSKKQDNYIVESLENQGVRNKNEDDCEVDGSKSKVKGEEIRSVKISFIANLEYRKGLDIFLESIYAYTYHRFLEVHLIGKIRKEWVREHMPKSILNSHIKLKYRPAMSQQELFDYLAKEQFDLNVQCSRFDSFAMVVPETMMQGIPNIVSPFVGAGEMITNGVDGFIMKKLDSQSLNEILNYYMTMNNKEKAILKQTVLLSSKNMVWENYYVNLGKVFKEILADFT